MMIPVDNKLAQPPNNKWNAIATTPAPVGQQVAFTDSTKQFVWIGAVSDGNAPLPSLVAMADIAAEQTPAFWSHISDQA